MTVRQPFFFFFLAPLWAGTRNVTLAPGHFAAVTAPLCYQDFQDVLSASGTTVTLYVNESATPLAGTPVAWQLFAQAGGGQPVCFTAAGAAVPPPFALQACASVVQGPNNASAAVNAAAAADPATALSPPFWAGDSHAFSLQRSRTVKAGVIELLTVASTPQKAQKHTELYLLGAAENVRLDQIRGAAWTNEEGYRRGRRLRL